MPAISPRTTGLVAALRDRAHLQKPCDAFGIPAIRLDRHRLQRRLHLPRLHQHSLEAGLAQSFVQPLRQRTGFEPDRRDPVRQLAHERNQRIGRASDLRLRHDLPLLAENADRRACKRYIQIDIDIHCRCPFLPRDWGAPFGKTPRTRYACKGNDTGISHIATNSNGAGERQAPLRHLENAPSRIEVARMTAALVDLFCRSFDAPPVDTQLPSSGWPGRAVADALMQVGNVTPLDVGHLVVANPGIDGGIH